MLKPYNQRHWHGHPYLVGNTGKVCSDNRLSPLKINKKYRNALKEEKCERDAKV